MKTALPILLLAAISPAFAVSVGDTYANVAEKGHAVGIMTAGSVSILSYPDLVIKLRDNTIVSFRAPGRAPAVVAGPGVSAIAGAKPSAQAYNGPAVWETDRWATPLRWRRRCGHPVATSRIGYTTILAAE